MNNFPKIHNAAWPGVVGKGEEEGDPIIGLDQMLDYTANAEVDGVHFDGIDLFLLDPHVSIDSSLDDLKVLSDKVTSRDLEIGSLVAPVWAPAGGGSAMGSADECFSFITQVRKACEIASHLKELGVRQGGVIRIDTSVDPATWAKNPKASNAKIVKTFQEACDIANDFGEKLAIEGEICWGGIHSWTAAEEILKSVERDNFGFQADMAHTLLYLLGYNAPECRVLPEDYLWKDESVLKESLEEITKVLRPYTIDFHVAQNDATVFGSGSHDKTGRHCLPDDPNGKLDIVRDAGYWLRNEQGKLTKSIRHICWDGCMFPNEVMTKPETWESILGVMIKVRNEHGWVN